MSLPEDVKDAIFGIDTAELMRKISAEHKLTIKQMGELADETGLLMMGFVKLNEYIPDIAKRLKVDKEIAGQIAKSVNARIFARIRDSLKKIHAPNGEDFSEETPIEQTNKNKPIIVKIPLTPPVINPSLTFAKKDPAAPKDENETDPQPPANLGTVSIAEKSPLQTELTESPDIKNIFQERQKEGMFRSKMETTETKITEEQEKAENTERPISHKSTNRIYPGGIDPYREPLG